MSRSIAIVIESLGGGGAQHVATTLANAWCAEGIATNVITLRGPESDVFHLDPRINRVAIGGSHDSHNVLSAILANAHRILRLRAALKASAAGNILGFVAATNVLTILASIGLGMHVTVSERNDPARQSLGRAWNILRKLVYRHADLVVANSNAAITTMSNYVPVERQRWLPNPLRAAPAGSGVTIPISNPFFLAVGRLDRQKGYDVLLDAFAELKTDLPDWHLVILGGGPMKDELGQQAANLGISDRVYFAGYMADPFPWYRAAKVFVHPARFEGLPNAVLEAMSERLPVVVTDSQEGLRDMLVDHKSGMVVPVNSARALAAAMMEAAKDPELRRRLGSAASVAVEPCKAAYAVAAWTTALGLVTSKAAIGVPN